MIRVGDSLPLRTTAEWGEYRRVAVIPRVYGDLREAPWPALPYSTDGRAWVAAAHHMESRAVYIDGDEAHGWEPRTEADTEGRPLHVIRLTAPAPEGAVVSVAGTGLRDAGTGALLEDPAAVLEDILGLAGVTPLSGAARVAFRAACGRASLTVGRALTQATTLRAQLDDLAASIGAAYSYRRWWLWPAAAPSIYRATLSTADFSSFESTAARRGPAVRVQYGYSAAEDDYRGNVLVGLVGRSGDPWEIQAPWQHSPAAAYRLAVAHAQWLGSLRASVQCTVRRLDILPGDWLLVSHPRLPGGAAAAMIVLDTAPDRAHHATRIAGALRWGAVPGVELLSHTRGWQPEAAGGFEVAAKDGVVTVTVYGPGGEPAAGAWCTLDGGQAKRADVRGQVVFFGVRAGVHTIAVELEGYQPWEQEITV